ncbi:uncharacterized protein LOC134346166 [Mobula hypostoma]|uniref:uncharacterized protein LOC134346166 n=1 Tax=Mobula hypostoma TaxID=723540 RepID=UPI002FC35CFA
MSEIMQMASLGRPFQLGMLYDCRADILIPDITLWDPRTLKNNLNRQGQFSTEFHIIALDSWDEKATALDVSGSLKVSLLCGLVNVKGSAEYLSDTKRSKQQARVTLQYKATTRFEQLTLSHLQRENIIYPSEFDEGSATHVVTAVLYGAQAFFVFDQMVSPTEKLQDVQRDMEVMVKRLPKIPIQGRSSLKMTEDQKSNAEKFRCTFYGDFSLKNNPTTFQDAISTYATLPSLLGRHGEHAVPVTVWLYPLNKLDSRAARLVREISVGLVNRCQRVLEQLHEAMRRSNDMVNDGVVIQFPEVGDRILQFRDMCQRYKLVFQRNLVRVLPSIRAGKEDELLLGDILKKRDQSPFKHQLLIRWLDGKEREMMIVRHYLNLLKGIPVLKSVGELPQELNNPAIDYVVCFSFTMLHQEDLYLSEAKNYLQSHTAQKMQPPDAAAGSCGTRHSEQWFNSQVVQQKMKEQSQLFLDFATANSAAGKVKFLVASVKDSSYIGASIYLYEGVCIKTRCFEPPSQPERPVACGAMHNSVTLQLQPPRYGACGIVSYQVEYRGPQQEEWITLDTPDKSHSFTISGLQPQQEYHFRYRAVTKIGVSPVSESCTVLTHPTGATGKMIFQSGLPNSALARDRRSYVGTHVDYFQKMLQQDRDKGHWSNKEHRPGKEVQTTVASCYNKSKTIYQVHVSADCRKAGSSADSNELPRERVHEPNRLAQKLLRQTDLISRGDPSIYLLKLQKEVFDQSKQLVKCSFGKPNAKQTMKTIMVLGATGSGKTTLINGMINYILGVEWEDNFRYMLIHEETGKSQAESQTSSITAYQLHHQVGFKINFSLTIIDTPGFGDTRGISRDQLITEHIREFFTSPQGVDQIDAVCFVAQASLARLTQTQKYVFDSILSIFGKDIADNIQILVTFADGHHPPVLEALKAAEMPCPNDKNGLPVHFKFNNSAVFAQCPASRKFAEKGSCDNQREVEENDDDFDAMFWMMGAKSMKKFFSALNKMETKSLSLTREVLWERKQLETTVEGLQVQIRVGLTKLEELRKTQQVLNQHQTELDANKDFEYEIEITLPEKHDISSTGNYITNCQKCHFTCHYPCHVPDDTKKYKCSAMNRIGNCTVCPLKCVWSVHFNQKYKFNYVTKKEKRTYDELKNKYQMACGEKMTQEKVMQTLQQELAKVENEVLGLIEELMHSISRLEKIALRPNPLSTPAYIELLIQSEKEEGKPGYMERIRALHAVKERAELIENVVNTDLLSEQWKLKTGQEKSTRNYVKTGVSMFCNWITHNK